MLCAVINEVIAVITMSMLATCGMGEKITRVMAYAKMPCCINRMISERDDDHAMSLLAPLMRILLRNA